MAGNDQGAGIRQPQPLLGELECSGHGEGRRGQNDRIQLVEKPLRQNCGDIDRGGLQESSRDRAARSSKRSRCRRISRMNFKPSISSSVRRISGLTSSGWFFNIFRCESGKLKSRKQIACSPRACMS